MNGFEQEPRPSSKADSAISASPTSGEWAEKHRLHRLERARLDFVGAEKRLLAEIDSVLSASSDFRLQMNLNMLENGACPEDDALDSPAKQAGKIALLKDEVAKLRAEAGTAVFPVLVRTPESTIRAQCPSCGCHVSRAWVACPECAVRITWSKAWLR